MPTVADVYRALNAMKDEGVVASYAVCGGTAALFYATETVRTFDIGIFILIPHTGSSLIITLDPIYAWARSKGYEIEAEHIYVHGVPVQFLDAGAGIELEAVQTANVLDYDGVPVPVIKPEHIVAIYAKVGGRNRITRALDILDAVPLDQDLLDDIIQRYTLQTEYRKLLSMR